MQKPANKRDAFPTDVRYRLARDLIGVPSVRDWLRAAIGGTLWFGAPLLVARAAARLGRRDLLRSTERWWARRLCAHLLIDLDLGGLDQIDPHTSYIVTPLHEGFADVLALLHLPLDLRFAARDELFGWRVLGPYLRDSGQVYVEPERGAWSYRYLVRQARSVFAAGESLVIFPQGSILGIETEFLRGAFTLARSLERPILPVALTGSHRVWEHPYTPRLRYGQRMSLRVLPPVTVDQIRDRSVEDVRRDVQRQIKTAALSADMAAPRHFVPARDGYWDGFAYRIDPDFPELAADVARHRREYAASQAATQPSQR